MGYPEQKDPRTGKAPRHQAAAKRGNNVSNTEISPAAKETMDDLLFENMLNENKEINRMLHRPLFRIQVDENKNNPEVVRIVNEIISIANKDFVNAIDSGVTDLLLELDDEIPLIYKNMREISLRKYRR